MESLDNKSSMSGFFKHVFNFDHDSKSDMLNIIQYTLLAIIPIVSINKAMQKYVPEANDDKGSVEISLEVVLQALLMFLGIFFVHRIVEYVPTFSGTTYPEFRVIYVILSILMVTLSLQTKLGEKVNILTIRLCDVWNGTSSQDKKKKKKAGNGNVSVSQPIVGGGYLPPAPQQVLSPNQEAFENALGSPQQPSGATPITNLPTGGQIPYYTNMYADQNTPLQGAATPGDGMMLPNEPVAASEFGGFGGSLFG